MLAPTQDWTPAVKRLTQPANTLYFTGGKIASIALCLALNASEVYTECTSYIAFILSLRLQNENNITEDLVQTSRSLL